MCFNLADGPRCRICADERRDPDLICVVEEPSDVISIERTHEFRGRYHVLGGALSPIDGVDPEDLKIAELYERVRAEAVREVVIATNPTTTGEATALHIADGLRDDRARHLGHAAGQRAAGRRRPGVRRRAHARPGVLRPPSGLGLSAPGATGTQNSAYSRIRARVDPHAIETDMRERRRCWKWRMKRGR